LDVFFCDKVTFDFGFVWTDSEVMFPFLLCKNKCPKSQSQRFVSSLMGWIAFEDIRDGSKERKEGKEAKDYYTDVQWRSNRDSG